MKFRLTSPHYIHDTYLNTDVEIGDGTPWPFKDAKGNYLPPTGDMVPLDDEAKAVMAKSNAVPSEELINKMTTEEPKEPEKGKKTL